MSTDKTPTLREAAQRVLKEVNTPECEPRFQKDCRLLAAAALSGEAAEPKCDCGRASCCYLFPATPAVVEPPPNDAGIGINTAATLVSMDTNGELMAYSEAAWTELEEFMARHLGEKK